MRKRIILLLCMLLVLGGCGKEASDNAGVYYPKISEKEVSAKYNSMALYMCSLLYYNGRMYTSAFHYQAEEKEDLDCTILGDEIGSVYGNHLVYWATDEDKLAESTFEGKLYRINGYDEDFRIAVYCEAYYESMLPPATTYNLIVFERLNDITLYSGNELFEDRFHLSEAAIVRSDTKEVEVDAAIKEFLDAMNEGIFLDPQDEEYLSLNSLQGYPLSFYDPIGLVTDIMVYEEGYVSMEQSAGKAFVLKMDAQECENILEKMCFGEPAVEQQTEQSSEQETESASEPMTEQQPVLTAEYELIYEGVSVFNSGTAGTYFKYKDICADLYMRRLQEDTGEYVELSLWSDQKEIWHTVDHESIYDSYPAKDNCLFWREDSEHLVLDRRLCYYVIPIDGDVYLMRYRVETASNAVTMSYKVFGIDSTIDSPYYHRGYEAPFDAGSITVYLVSDSDVDRDVSFPIDEMTAFADAVRGYMESGYLAVSTLCGVFESGISADRDNPVSPYLYDIFPWIPELAAQQDISTEDIHSPKKLFTALQKALPEDTSVTMPEVATAGKYFITGDYYSNSDESYLTVRMNEDGSYKGTLLIDNLLNIEYAGHYDNGILTAVRISDYPDDPPYEMEISFKGGRATVTLTAAYEEGYAEVGDTFMLERNQKPKEFEYLKNAEDIPRE